MLKLVTTLFILLVPTLVHAQWHHTDVYPYVDDVDTDVFGPTSVELFALVAENDNFYSNYKLEFYGHRSGIKFLMGEKIVDSADGGGALILSNASDHLFQYVSVYVYGEYMDPATNGIITWPFLGGTTWANSAFGDTRIPFDVGSIVPVEMTQNVDKLEVAFDGESFFATEQMISGSQLTFRVLWYEGSDPTLDDIIAEREVTVDIELLGEFMGSYYYQMADHLLDDIGIDASWPNGTFIGVSVDCTKTTYESDAAINIFHN